MKSSIASVHPVAEAQGHTDHLIGPILLCILGLRTANLCVFRRAEGHNLRFHLLLFPLFLLTHQRNHNQPIFEAYALEVHGILNSGRHFLLPD